MPRDGLGHSETLATSLRIDCLNEGPRRGGRGCASQTTLVRANQECKAIRPAQVAPLCVCIILRAWIRGRRRVIRSISHCRSLSADAEAAGQPCSCAVRPNTRTRFVEMKVEYEGKAIDSRSLSFAFCTMSANVCGIYYGGPEICISSRYEGEIPIRRIRSWKLCRRPILTCKPRGGHPLPILLFGIVRG